MTYTSEFKKKNHYGGSLFKNKCGQAETASTASSAAALILLITVVIVVYLLFLPPAERERILEGNVPGTTTGIDSHTDLLGTKTLDETPGKIDYIKDNKIEHDLASFRIYTSTDAEIITEISSMYVKNSVFERKFREMPFTIDESLTDNVYLSFNVLKPSGELKIYLNTVLIFEGELKEGSINPIHLPKEHLKNNNLLYFKPSAPGFAFWRVHEYTLSNLRLTGDVIDEEHSFHMQQFYIEENELNNFEKAILEFYPDCNPREVNKITINVNRNKIYEGIPDCNMPNKVFVVRDVLRAGDNTLEFTSDKGSYIMDMVQMEIGLNSPEYPIYYFDLSDDLFVEENIDDSFCGKIDGICPSGCEEYEDKDCCFSESRKNYWCDVKTNNPRDRCVNSFLSEYEERCPSLYEDVRGDPLEESEGMCGDDTDGNCPAGCSELYDKDCCFNGKSNYWCEDIPLTGIDSVCTPVVTQSECNSCPNNYINSENERPNCPTYDDDDVSGEEKLKSSVDIILDVDFVDEDYKKVDFVINGNRVPVDTYYLSYVRLIDDYVKSGVNSIQIEPRGDVTISQLRVKIE